MSDQERVRSAVATGTQTEIAVLAGGCFWGVEEILRGVPGVIDTDVGYTGGWLENPTYDNTHDSKSGHAEAIRVTFDPAVLSYEDLLEQWFFKLHDPTTLNRQGNDVGTQYRSAIFPQPPTPYPSWSRASTWSATRRPSRDSRPSAIGARAPTATAPPWTGSRRSSGATAAATCRASSTTISRRRRGPAIRRHEIPATPQAAAATAASGPGPASTAIRSSSPTRVYARSTPKPPRRARAKRSTAPRSARRTPTRCTSSAATWTGSAGARRQMTTARAQRSSWSWPASSAALTSAPIARSGSPCGTMKRLGSTAHAPTSSNAARSRARSKSPSGS